VVWCNLPDGLTHVKIWKAFLPLTISLVVYFAIVGWWYFAIWILFGSFLHWLGFDPDLDLEGINRGEALWIKSIVLIPLIGWSTLYARIFQKFGGHRSIWTHGPFISTFIRLMFFGFPFVWWFRQHYLDPLYVEFSGIYVGMAISDLWHIGADFITGEMNFFGHAGGKSKFLKHAMKVLFDYPSDIKIRAKQNRERLKQINEEE
jgi:hypothetical protein